MNKRIVGRSSIAVSTHCQVEDRPLENRYPNVQAFTGSCPVYDLMIRPMYHVDRWVLVVRVLAEDFSRVASFRRGFFAFLANDFRGHDREYGI